MVSGGNASSLPLVGGKPEPTINCLLYTSDAADE